MSKPAANWPHLTVATANAGPAKTAEFLAILAEQPDLICCQEFGDQAATRAALDHHGYGVQEGHGKAGQKSTPTFYRRATMTPRRRWYVALLGAVFAGKGAGPSRLKPKWLDGLDLIHDASGRRVQAASYHAPASQQFQLRRRLAATALAKAIPAFGRGLVRVCGMDSNDHSGQVDKAFARAGWTSSDNEGKPLATHGRHNYDRIFWHRSRLVRFVEHHVVKIGSDHLAKVATLAIKPRQTDRKKAA